MTSSYTPFYYPQAREMNADRGDFANATDGGTEAMTAIETDLFGIDTISAGMAELGVEGTLAPPSSPIGGPALGMNDLTVERAMAPPPSAVAGIVSVHEGQVSADETSGSSPPWNALRTQLPARPSIVRRGPRKSRRAVRHVPAVPRRDRVYRTCHMCGERNHVRRLFCVSCICPRRK